MPSPVLSWNNIVCAALPKFNVENIKDSHVITLTSFRTMNSTLTMSKTKINKALPFFLTCFPTALMNLKEMQISISNRKCHVWLHTLPCGQEMLDVPWPSTLLNCCCHTWHLRAGGCWRALSRPVWGALNCSSLAAWQKSTRTCH